MLHNDSSTSEKYNHAKEDSPERNLFATADLGTSLGQHGFAAFPATTRSVQALHSVSNRQQQQQQQNQQQNRGRSNYVDDDERISAESIEKIQLKLRSSISSRKSLRELFLALLILGCLIWSMLARLDNSQPLAVQKATLSSQSATQIMNWADYVNQIKASQAVKSQVNGIVFPSNHLIFSSLWQLRKKTTTDCTSDDILSHIRPANTCNLLSSDSFDSAAFDVPWTNSTTKSFQSCDQYLDNKLPYFTAVLSPTSLVSNLDMFVTQYGYFSNAGSVEAMLLLLFYNPETSSVALVVNSAVFQKGGGLLQSESVWLGSNEGLPSGLNIVSLVGELFFLVFLLLTVILRLIQLKSCFQHVKLALLSPLLHLDLTIGGLSIALIVLKSQRYSQRRHLYNFLSSSSSSLASSSFVCDSSLPSPVSTSAIAYNCMTSDAILANVECFLIMFLLIRVICCLRFLRRLGSLPRAVIIAVPELGALAFIVVLVVIAMAAAAAVEPWSISSQHPFGSALANVINTLIVNNSNFSSSSSFTYWVWSIALWFAFVPIVFSIFLAVLLRAFDISRREYAQGRASTVLMMTAPPLMLIHEQMVLFFKGLTTTQSAWETRIDDACSTLYRHCQNRKEGMTFQAASMMVGEDTAKSIFLATKTGSDMSIPVQEIKDSSNVVVPDTSNNNRRVVTPLRLSAVMTPRPMSMETSQPDEPMQFNMFEGGLTARVSRIEGKIEDLYHGIIAATSAVTAVAASAATPSKPFLPIEEESLMVDTDSEHTVSKATTTAGMEALAAIHQQLNDTPSDSSRHQHLQQQHHLAEEAVTGSWKRDSQLALQELARKMDSMDKVLQYVRARQERQGAEQEKLLKEIQWSIRHGNKSREGWTNGYEPGKSDWII